MNRIAGMLRAAVVVGIVGSSTGCLAAAAAAGAGGAVAYSNRGAEGNVAGTVDAAFARAVSVFQSMGITETGRSSEHNGAERKLTGTKGDVDVDVVIERENAGTSKVRVYAKRNKVDYQQTMSDDILARIVAGG
jgi:hypothetical protein